MARRARQLRCQRGLAAACARVWTHYQCDLLEKKTPEQGFKDCPSRPSSAASADLPLPARVRKCRQFKYAA